MEESDSQAVPGDDGGEAVKFIVGDQDSLDGMIMAVPKSGIVLSL